MSLVLLKSDGREFGQLGNLYAAAGKNAPRAVRLAVKEVGNLARTQMRRGIRSELGEQRGLAKQINKRVIGKVIAGSSTAEYHITARGTIPLKYLKTVQTPHGVIVPGVNSNWIGGKYWLDTSFEAKTGSSGTWGDAAKRRKTLHGQIFHRESFERSPLGITEGVILAKVFVAHKPSRAFYEAAARLPGVMGRLLFAAATGKLRASRSERAALERRFNAVRFV